MKINENENEKKKSPLFSTLIFAILLVEEYIGNSNLKNTSKTPTSLLSLFFVYYF